MYRCPYCPLTYKEQSSLSHHKKRKHLIEYEKEKTAREDRFQQKKAKHSFSCPECEWTGPSKARMNAHLRRKHKIITYTSDDLIYECFECSAFFPTVACLRDHFYSCHDKKFEKKTFKNWRSFESWKSQLEADKCIHFVTHRSSTKLKSGIIVTAFYCSNSGNHYPHKGKGIRPNRPSKRTGFICSAYMVARLSENGTVTAHFCSEHNHELMPETLPLRAEDKRTIVKYLREGLTTKHIVQLIRQNRQLTRNDPLFYIVPKDVSNVRAEKNIPECETYSSKDDLLWLNEETGTSSSSSHQSVDSPASRISPDQIIVEADYESDHEVLASQCHQLIERTKKKLRNFSTERLNCLKQVMENIVEGQSAEMVGDTVRIASSRPRVATNLPQYRLTRVRNI